MVFGSGWPSASRRLFAGKNPRGEKRDVVCRKAFAATSVNSRAAELLQRLSLVERQFEKPAVILNAAFGGSATKAE